MKELVKTSYAEQEMISIHPEKTSVEDILNTACQMVELVAIKKKINIVLEEISHVTVSVILYESFVCIQVKDQGIGIREEEQGMVFERFYRSKDVRVSLALESGFIWQGKSFLSKAGM